MEDEIKAQKLLVDADVTTPSAYASGHKAGRRDFSMLAMLFAIAGEYDGDIRHFDNPRIDELILARLRQMVRLPDWTVAARWHGTYAKHPDKPIVYAEPQTGGVMVMAAGGAGMTLAFGLARDWWEGHET